MDARVIIRDVEFVRVEPGPFRMGWPRGHPSEAPAHEVWLDAFLIASTPVTNAEFTAYLHAIGAPAPAFWDRPGFSRPRQPVVGLS